MSDVSLLRVAEVCRRTGLSRSTIYARESAGNFPKRIKIGKRASAWRSDEIAAYIDRCTATARAAS
jgi:prophage regulatory protein